MDARAPRDGRVIEQLGTYDTSVPETDARAILKGERIAYWLGVGAQATPKVATLIKKYGICLLYTSPSPRDLSTSRMPSSA